MNSGTRDCLAEEEATVNQGPGPCVWPLAACPPGEKGCLNRDGAEAAAWQAWRLSFTSFPFALSAIEPRTAKSSLSQSPFLLEWSYGTVLASET